MKICMNCGHRNWEVVGKQPKCEECGKQLSGPPVNNPRVGGKQLSGGHRIAPHKPDRN